MAGGPYVWGALDRAVNDDTKIDDAISVAIEAHNEDPESHLGADQSLESHRAAEIIDHLAESVVNDKIATLARAYTAIVDPSSDVDFDTIESAHAYTVAKGGGNILITPGSYYLASIIELDGTVNFYGTDPDTCIIYTDYDDDFFFETGYWPTDWSGNFVFENLTINAVTARSFVMKSGGEFYQSTLIINNCILKGAGKYTTKSVGTQHISNSTIYATANAAVGGGFNNTLVNIRITAESGSSTVYFLDGDGDGEVYQWNMQNVVSDNFSSYPSGFRLDVFGPNSIIESFIAGCHFWRVSTNTIYLYSMTMVGTFFEMYSTDRLTLNLFVAKVIGCTVFTGGTNNLIIDSGSSGYAFIGNRHTGFNSQPPSGGIIVGVGEEADFTTLSNSATACDLLNNNVAQLTPTSTRTLTSTVPPAGQRRTIIILTSGTTTYTLTFGTGFKTTGTLATGATSARRFVIEFVSDGTQLIETSRTVAIA